jgi:fatty acid desaturase
MTDAIAELPSTELSRRAVPADLLQPATAAGLLRMAFEEWAVILACWAILLLVPRPALVWIYPVVAVILAGRFHALGVVLHDAAHMPPRRRSVATSFVEMLCGFPLATTIAAMRYHHLRHHRDSSMETDPYLKQGARTPAWWLVQVMRGAVLLPFWTVRAVVGALSLAIPDLRRPYARVFLQDREEHDFVHSDELQACARAELGQLAFQSIVLVAALVWPVPILLGYVIPATITGLLAAYRLLNEHTNDLVNDRRIETIVATTRDNHLGWLGRFLLAPRNVGYHVVHHIHPHVGLEHLPRLREWYGRTYPDLSEGGR